MEVLLNTLEHERHARRGLLVALLEEMGTSVADRAPESTRDLLARAESGKMADAEWNALLRELRAFVRTAA